MQHTRSTTLSHRRHNKWRHQYPLGKDDHGKQLYPDDFVRVSNPHENKGEWCTQIRFNFCDGGFFETHPANINRNGATYDDNLTNFIRKYNGSQHTIVKITQNEYEKWCMLQNVKKYVDKPREFDLPKKIVVDTNVEFEW